MAVPIVAAAVTAVRAFATRYGVKKAVEKFGDEAVQQASDNLSGVTAGDAATRKSPDRKPPEERPSKSTGEVDRMRKVGQRSAFKQAGEREAAKKSTAPTTPTAKRGNTTVTATRSDAKKARESMSGPNARPASKLAGPPTAPKSDLKSSGATAASKGDRRTPTAAIVGEKSTGASGAKDNPKTVGKAKKRGSDTFIGKDGKKKAAVTKEELKASGLSLRDYLNKQRGLTRKKPVKKSMGGKVKAYSSGGSVRGGGKARKTNSCTMVTMKGS